MSYDVLSSKKVDHGVCLIDVYRAPGDLYDSWDIVYANPDGSFDRVPDARYGPDAPDYEHTFEMFAPMRITENYTRWNQNGWTKEETTIRADGKIVASRCNG